MSNDALRQEMVALLGRIVGPGPLPADLQRQALQMLESMVQQPGAAQASPPAGGAAPPAPARADALGAAAAAAVGNRRLIYVHGICQHGPNFSDPWWNSLRPFVPSAFGQGMLGQTRLEVVWSHIMNQAAANLAAVMGADPGGVPREERDRQQTAEEIKEAMRDRADQEMLNASATMDGLGTAPMAATETAGLISIPGANCVDDFSIYLINNAVRQQIIDCFTNVVRPQLQAGRELDVVGHSWGTVVAYEGLRQLEDEGLNAPLVRNFFTIGAALSIGPVKMRLRPANKDGRKPASVRRWINLDARGDIVGGPLQGRPYAVDVDRVNLEPFGCGSFLGLINPQCAHSSYFQAGNTTVNRDILAASINLSL